MPRPSNTGQRRDEIARGLAVAMARTGYDRATIASIAEEAGVAPGGVHYHFDSKGEILVHLVQALVATAEERVEVRSQAARDGRGRLEAIIDALLAVGADAAPDAAATWALIGAEAIHSPEVRAVRSPWVMHAARMIRDAFEEACRDEGRRAVQPDCTAAGLLALVEGFYTLAASTPDVIPAGSAAATTRQVAGTLIDSQPKVDPT